jgi:hypothetical protein
MIFLNVIEYGQVFCADTGKPMAVDSMPTLPRSFAYPMSRVQRVEEMDPDPEQRDRYMVTIDGASGPTELICQGCITELESEIGAWAHRNDTIAELHDIRKAIEKLVLVTCAVRDNIGIAGGQATMH